METRIESPMERWKHYNTTNRRYYLGRSCAYESSPPGSSFSFYPLLTVRIFVHGTSSGEGGEWKIGEVSIFVDRDRWNNIANLNNAAEADNQLRRASISVKEGKEGSWEIEPLPRMLRKGCEVIQTKIDGYETNGFPISGEFSI